MGTICPDRHTIGLEAMVVIAAVDTIDKGFIAVYLDITDSRAAIHNNLLQNQQRIAKTHAGIVIYDDITDYYSAIRIGGGTVVKLLISCG